MLFTGPIHNSLPLLERCCNLLLFIPKTLGGLTLIDPLLKHPSWREYGELLFILLEYFLVIVSQSGDLIDVLDRVVWT